MTAAVCWVCWTTTHPDQPLPHTTPRPTLTTCHHCGLATRSGITTEQATVTGTGRTGDTTGRNTEPATR